MIRADGCPSKRTGRQAGKSAWHTPEALGRPERSGPVHDAKPTRKAPKVERPPVPKPTQVGGYQHTQARERTLVKELGTLAP